MLRKIGLLTVLKRFHLSTVQMCRNGRRKLSCKVSVSAQKERLLRGELIDQLQSCADRHWIQRIPESIWMTPGIPRVSTALAGTMLDRRQRTPGHRDFPWDQSLRVKRAKWSAEWPAHWGIKFVQKKLDFRTMCSFYAFPKRMSILYSLAVKPAESEINLRSWNLQFLMGFQFTAVQMWVVKNRNYQECEQLNHDTETLTASLTALGRPMHCFSAFVPPLESCCTKQLLRRRACDVQNVWDWSHLEFTLEGRLWAKFLLFFFYIILYIDMLVIHRPMMVTSIQPVLYFSRCLDVWCATQEATTFDGHRV